MLVGGGGLVGFFVGLGLGAGFLVGLGVAVGSGVSVGRGVSVGGGEVGVAVSTMGVFVGVTGVGVKVGVGVSVGMGVFVGVGVTLKVGLGVLVGVDVGSVWRPMSVLPEQANITATMAITAARITTRFLLLFIIPPMHLAGCLQSERWDGPGPQRGQTTVSARRPWRAERALLYHI